MASATREERTGAQPEITPSDALSIAKEAFIYGFPMIDSYRILYSYFVDKSDPTYKGGWNIIHHEAQGYTPADKLPTPNLDTSSSILGADLRSEPLVLSMPQVEGNRYYSVQFIDLYTFNFFYVGTRTMGNDTASFLFAGPHWRGEKPPGIKRMIRSETDLALVMYRTQLFNHDDIVKVKKIQSGYKVQTLSEYLNKPAMAVASEIDFITPIAVDQERTSLEFLNVLNFLLQFCSIHPSELGLMSRFARLGIRADKKFYSEGLSPEIHQAIEDGMVDAWKAEATLVKHLREGKIAGVNLFGNREYMGNNYLNRMAAAAIGIHSNSWEETIYIVYHSDSGGHPLNAKNHQYKLRFRGGRLPPVSAFWSVTLYDLPSQTLNDNILHRHLVNSLMLSEMKRDPDGGATIYVRHQSPGEDVQSNWLPAPAGPFMVTLRLYAPRPEISTWKAPTIDREK